MGTLHNEYHATDAHPWPKSLEDDADVPEVVLPVLFYAALDELVKWQRGEDYNSCLRIVVSKQKRATLFITTTRRINTTNQDGHRRAIGMADATANRAILERWYGGEVVIDRPEVKPPSHTRHYHVHERCSKTSMQQDHGRDLARAIRKLRFFLKQVDPQGEKAREGKVGLITYMGNEKAMREALGIPEGRSTHFWAARGSNGLEQCEILLLVGTPTLAPETVYRIARTLYRDDPQPIREGSHPTENGRSDFVYDDDRVQHLAEYLTNAELTQCAHRHRPLRYNGRITISLCKADIDYLPVTHFVSNMPRLTTEGEEARLVKEAEDNAKLDQARRQLEAQGIRLAIHRLGRVAGVATDTAARYLHKWREDQAEAHEQHHTTHTPHQCSQNVPENP